MAGSATGVPVPVPSVLGKDTPSASNREPKGPLAPVFSGGGATGMVCCWLLLLSFQALKARYARAARPAFLPTLTPAFVVPPPSSMGAAVARAAPRPPARPASPDTSMVPRTFFKSANSASLCSMVCNVCKTAMVNKLAPSGFRTRADQNGGHGRDRKKKLAFTCDVIDRRRHCGPWCAWAPDCPEAQRQEI